MSVLQFLGLLAQRVVDAADDPAVQVVDEHLGLAVLHPLVEVRTGHVVLQVRLQSLGAVVAGPGTRLVPAAPAAPAVAFAVEVQADGPSDTVGLASTGRLDEDRDRDPGVLVVVERAFRVVLVVLEEPKLLGADLAPRLVLLGVRLPPGPFDHLGHTHLLGCRYTPTYTDILRVSTHGV